MIINDVNLESLSRDEYFSFIKIILLSFQYMGFDYNEQEINQINSILDKNESVVSKVI